MPSVRSLTIEYMENKTTPESVIDSMRAVIAYLYEEEQRHYEESDNERGHIFEDIRRVKQWLEDNLN